MAGIGQRNTFDHPASWSSAAQLGMGRTMPNDSSKNLTNFPSGSDKRSLLNNTPGASVLTSLNSGSNFSYSSRTSSSTRSKGLTSTGGTLRTNYPDSNLDNGAIYFPPYSHSSYPNAHQRGLSESSLLSGLGSSDLSNLVSGLGNNCKSPLGGSVLGGTLKPSTVGNSAFFSSSGNVSSNSLLNAGLSCPGLTFDPSDFPPIANPTGRSQGQAFSGNALHRNYVSVISKGSNPSINAIGTQNAFSNAVIQPTPEFSIDQDFPALPVAQSTPSVSTVPQSAMILSVANSIQSVQSLNAASGGSIKNQASQRLHRSQSGGSSYVSSTQGGFLELLPDNLVANIPKNMICDQFGMIGLLKLIQIGCYDSTFEMLAPGLMLTSLGIVNWSQPGELHTSLASPCQESCMGRPHDMDYNVPPEYLIRHLVANRLPDPPLDHLSEETLFWLFYNCCREEVQLVVAKELYRRDWRFHKKEQLWLTRVVNADFSTDNASEQGVYSYWDPHSAEKMTREMKICYADLDDTPKNFHLSSNTLNAAVTTQSHAGVGNNAFAAAAYQQLQQKQQAQVMSSGGGGNPLNSAFSAAHFPSSLLSAAAVVNNNSIGRPGARPTTKMSATAPPSSSSSSNNSQQQQPNGPAIFVPTIAPNNSNSEKMADNGSGGSKRNPSSDPATVVANS